MPTLPAEFADLEPFADWAIATERERYAKRLLWLYCSLVTVSFPVEVWRQPRVPDSGSTRLDAVAEPVV